MTDKVKNAIAEILLLVFLLYSIIIISGTILHPIYKNFKREQDKKNDYFPIIKVPPTFQAKPAVPPALTSITVVEVIKQLEKLEASQGKKLNWKISIVDIMKLLSLDSRFAKRKELAVELGCPSENMDNSSNMNTWLHKTFLQKLAENGGSVPKKLLY